MADTMYRPWAPKKLVSDIPKTKKFLRPKHEDTDASMDPFHHNCSHGKFARVPARFRKALLRALSALLPEGPRTWKRFMHAWKEAHGQPTLRANCMPMLRADKRPSRVRLAVGGRVWVLRMVHDKRSQHDASTTRSSKGAYSRVVWGVVAKTRTKIRAYRGYQSRRLKKHRQGLRRRMRANPPTFDDTKHKTPCDVTEYVHRVVLFLVHGPPPAGMLDAQACHACGNRSCLNPYHLYWGSDKDNKADRSFHAHSHNNKRSAAPWGNRYADQHPSGDVQYEQWLGTDDGQQWHAKRSHRWWSKPVRAAPTSGEAC